MTKGKQFMVATKKRKIYTIAFKKKWKKKMMFRKEEKVYMITIKD